MSKTYEKSPNGELDWLFDWRSGTNGNGGSDWLASGETILSYTITADDGITVDSDGLTNSNTSVQVWLSGGTVGQSYDVNCAISTTNSPTRVDDRTITIRVVNR